MVFLANWILSIEDHSKLVYWLHVSSGFKVVGVLGILIMFIVQIGGVIDYYYEKKFSKKFIIYTIIVEIIFLDMAIFLPTENLAISMGLL